MCVCVCVRVAQISSLSTRTALPRDKLVDLLNVEYTTKQFVDYLTGNELKTNARLRKESGGQSVDKGQSVEATHTRRAVRLRVCVV